MQTFDVKLMDGRTDELFNERTDGMTKLYTPDIFRISGV